MELLESIASKVPREPEEFASWTLSHKILPVANLYDGITPGTIVLGWVITSEKALLVHMHEEDAILMVSSFPTDGDILPHGTAIVIRNNPTKIAKVNV